MTSAAKSGTLSLVFPFGSGAWSPNPPTTQANSQLDLNPDPTALLILRIKRAVVLSIDSFDGLFANRA